MLLGAGGCAGWYAVQALRALATDDLVRDVHLLAVHHEWAVRSLAALTWANSAPSDAAVGLLLASDLDQRVRRSLADGLRGAVTTAATEQVRKTLAADSRHSVRSLLSRARFGDEDRSPASRGI